MTFSARTSPTANTPGKLVSNRYGDRASGQCEIVKSARVSSVPVLIKPFSSTWTQPASQPVLGIAPVEAPERIALVAVRFDAGRVERDRTVTAFDRFAAAPERIEGKRQVRMEARLRRIDRNCFSSSGSARITLCPIEVALISTRSTQSNSRSAVNAKNA